MEANNLNVGESLEAVCINEAVLSFILNDRINFKGVYLKYFSFEIDDESLIISDGCNIEFMYPIKKIANIDINEMDHNLTLITDDNIEISITKIS